MIDIHCHILPGLDDGAPDMRTATEMLRLAAYDGITDIVATPHANTMYPFDPAMVEAALADLRPAARGGVRLHYGCELHITPENIDRVLREPWHYTIGHCGYVLVEFSNMLVPKTSGLILQRLRDAGARPVIAHPERNPILRKRGAEVESWVKAGCLLQVTAQSLLGQFGRSAETAALDLVAEGLAHCVASDAHSCGRRPPILSEARRLVEGAFGAETALQLFEENPCAILCGGTVQRVLPEARKPWYALW